MNKKRQYKTYTKAFKEGAVAVVIDQDYTVSNAAQSLGIRSNLLYGWKQQFEEKQTASILSSDERAELMKYNSLLTKPYFTDIEITAVPVI